MEGEVGEVIGTEVGSSEETGGEVREGWKKKGE